MLSNLVAIVRELKRDMRSNPKDYIENGCDEPSIDIRLCVDRHEYKPSLPCEYTWLFRVGLVDYDPRHSDYCAASSVQLDTDPDKLLTMMINDLKTQ